jgi:hypothetical protein
MSSDVIFIVVFSLVLIGILIFAYLYYGTDLFYEKKIPPTVPPVAKAFPYTGPPFSIATKISIPTSIGSDYFMQIHPSSAYTSIAAAPTVNGQSATFIDQTGDAVYIITPSGVYTIVPFDSTNQVNKVKITVLPPV